MIHAGCEYNGNILFKIGSEPSVCDRNNIDYRFREYMNMDAKLQGIIYTSDDGWVFEVGDEYYHRWSRRWDEVHLDDGVL